MISEGSVSFFSSNARVLMPSSVGSNMPCYALSCLLSSVSAVYASAHDEVCGHIMCVVRTFSDKHAASGIGIAVQVFVDSFHLFRLSHFDSDSFVHCLFHCTVDFIDKNTCSSARGSNSHSACSITRRCKVSGVSPGSTSTAFCMIISPPSATAFT